MAGVTLVVRKDPGRPHAPAVYDDGVTGCGYCCTPDGFVPGYCPFDVIARWPWPE